MVDTARLDRQVKKYKNQKSKREKDEQFEEITKILTHHIRALRSYLLGNNNDQTISPAVKKIILSNMMSTTTIKNEDDFLFYLKQNVQLAGYTKEDIDQIIMLHLVELLNCYKYQKTSFLHFVTFLLPRRVIQDIWKTTKDQLQQMYTIVDVTPNNEFVDTIQSSDNTDQDMIFFDYIEQYDVLMEELESQATYQFIKSKKRGEHNEQPTKTGNSGDGRLDIP